MTEEGRAPGQPGSPHHDAAGTAPGAAAPCTHGLGCEPLPVLTRIREVFALRGRGPLPFLPNLLLALRAGVPLGVEAPHRVLVADRAP